jgi:CDP-4-dehydro-6-deoxyglucose reductase, E1
MENKDMRVPYALAVHGDEEERAVLEILRSSRTIMGPKTKKFEDSVAALFGKKYGVMVNSGSSANLLALEALDLPEGLEVITPALTFSTTVAPILQRRLNPVFVDVEQGTYQIDVSKIEEKITPKTKVLMIPSLIGNLPNMERIRNIALTNSLIYLEDSCDTLGAQYNGLSTGCYSDISTTSFYGSHIITAAGGGGMLCTNNKEWEKKYKILRGWGRSSAVDENEDVEKRFGVELDGVPYDTKFIFEAIGYNFLPTEISAAFGLEQLAKLAGFSDKRERNFGSLHSFFSGREEYFILPEQSDKVRTNWLAFPLTIKEDAPFTRKEITSYLESNNIQTRPVFTGNILRQPAFRHLKDSKNSDFPVADHVMKSGFLVGCNHGLNDKHIDYMKEKFTAFLDKF